MIDQCIDILNAFRAGQTDFKRIILKQARFQTAFLPFIDLEKAALKAADMRHVVMPGVNFQGADLERVNLEHANLLSADLSWATLSQATLDHALLSSATLVGADLTSATLTGANLANADLRSANLRNANLIGANLKGANLSQANLFGAKLDMSALADVTLDLTVLPNGMCHSLDREALSQRNIPISNYMSYSRIAHSLKKQQSRKISKVAKTSSDSKPKKVEATTVQRPVSVPSSSDETLIEVTPTPLLVGFRFSNETGDLVLEFVHPDHHLEETFIPLCDLQDMI